MHLLSHLSSNFFHDLFQLLPQPLDLVLRLPVCDCLFPSFPRILLFLRRVFRRPKKSVKRIQNIPFLGANVFGAFVGMLGMPDRLGKRGALSDIVALSTKENTIYRYHKPNSITLTAIFTSSSNSTTFRPLSSHALAKRSS